MGGPGADEIVRAQSQIVFFALIIAASMMGVFFSVISTSQAVLGRELTDGSANTARGLIRLDPGAVLALIAATCNLFTTGTRRERNERSPRAAGAPRAMPQTAGFSRAGIYTETAFLLCLLVSAFASLMIGLPVALTGGGLHFAVNVWGIALTVLIGFIPLAISARMPTIAAARKSLGTGAEMTTMWSTISSTRLHNARYKS